MKNLGIYVYILKLTFCADAE